MADIKTVVLNNEETRVDLGRRNCHIRNMGSETIYASVQPGIIPDADGVLSVLAGAVDTLVNTDGHVYLKGTGKVQLVGSDFADGILGGLAGAGDIGAAVAAAVAKIVADAPEDFDTLKEISDWIESHSESAAAMNSEITALKTNKADKTEIPDASTFADNKVLNTLEQVNNPDLKSGIYSVEGVMLAFASQVLSRSTVLIVNKHRRNSGYGVQIGIPYDDGQQMGVYYRMANAGVWSDWISLADGGNADTVDDKHSKDFFQFHNLNGAETSVLTGLHNGLYFNNNWTNYPSDAEDNQGMVISINYSQDQDMLSGWTRRFFIEPHGKRTWVNQALLNTDNWLGWQLISDGGNADMLDGLHASDFIKREGTTDLIVVPYNFNTDGSVFSAIIKKNLSGKTDISGFYMKNTTNEIITLTIEGYSDYSVNLQIGYGTGNMVDMHISGIDREYFLNTNWGPSITKCSIGIPVGKTGYLVFSTANDIVVNITVTSLYSTDGYNVCTAASYAANAGTLSGLHVNEIASNPNLLINPDFRINQRGVTEAETGDWNAPHVVDRWRLTAAGLLAQTNGIKITDSGFTRKDEQETGNLTQLLPDELIAFINGKTCTLSAGASNGEIISKTFVYDISSNDYNTEVKGSDNKWGISFYHWVSYYSNRPCILAFTNDTSIIVNWVKLELGSVATPFVPPDPATELIKCQRYYCKSYPQDIAPQTPGAYDNELITGSFNESQFLQNWFPFPVTMCRVPTLRLISSNSGAIGKCIMIGGSIETDISALVVGTNGFVLAPTTGLTLGGEYVFQFDADAEIGG